MIRLRGSLPAFLIAGVVAWTAAAFAFAYAVPAADQVSITAPANDARGPAHYRTKMAGVMLTRALARASSRARG